MSAAFRYLQTNIDCNNSTGSVEVVDLALGTVMFVVTGDLSTINTRDGPSFNLTVLTQDLQVVVGMQILSFSVY